MSGPPPEDHTRRLTPAAAVPTTPREQVYVEGDPEMARAAILDELRSLKRWLAVVAVIALAGLGVALYALLAEDEEGDGRGASRTSVRQLDNRVDALEDDVRNRASDGSVSKLRAEQQALEDRVDDLAEKAEGGVDAGAIEDATDDLRSQIAELDGRVDAVEEQAASDTGGAQDEGSR